jgi:RNA polymerase sigma-70 factor (ECF subfamily)
MVTVGVDLINPPRLFSISATLPHCTWMIATAGDPNSRTTSSVPAVRRKKLENFFPPARLIWRDVMGGFSMSIALTHLGSAPSTFDARATASDFSDEMLVARVAAGDKLAMEVLFVRHRTLVYRWLLRFIGNEAVAEDLLSDVFLDVWQQAGRFERRAAVGTWLLSIARFKALSARRRRTDAQFDESIEATVPDGSDDPEIALQKKSRDQLLRQALTKLSADHREIIDLVYYHEKSVEECAIILGIPAATVKTRMFYARKKLAELIREAY